MYIFIVLSPAGFGVTVQVGLTVRVGVTVNVGVAELPVVIVKVKVAVAVDVQDPVCVGVWVNVLL